MLGRTYQEPYTCQDVLREIRVCSIQLCLSRHFSMGNAELEATVRSLRYLGGFAYAYKHYGVDGYDSHDLHPILWSEVQNRAEELDIAQLWAEWVRKLALWPVAPSD